MKYSRKISMSNSQKTGLSTYKKRGRLLCSIPADRYRLASDQSHPPKVGDIVGLDQGFTGPDGQQMTLVYAFNGTRTLYEAELCDSEFDLLLEG
jgi:hypothetical protein